MDIMNDFLVALLPISWIGCWGIIWLPIVGLIIGKFFVKKTEALQNVEPNLGGCIGTFIGIAIWLVFVFVWTLYFHS